MSIKKIKIKTKSENFGKALSILFPETTDITVHIIKSEDTNIITFTTLLSVSKQTFVTLSTSEFIEDWDMEEEGETQKKDLWCSHQESFMDKPVNYEPSDVISDLDIKTFNELATFIEAIWKVGLRSPGLVMKSVLGWKKIKETYSEVASSPISIDHALLKMIIENYYSGGLGINEATEDVIGRMEKLWKSMPSYTSLSSIAQALFKK